MVCCSYCSHLSPGATSVHKFLLTASTVALLALLAGCSAGAGGSGNGGGSSSASESVAVPTGCPKDETVTAALVTANVPGARDAKYRDAPADSSWGPTSGTYCAYSFTYGDGKYADPAGKVSSSIDASMYVWVNRAISANAVAGYTGWDESGFGGDVFTNNGTSAVGVRTIIGITADFTYGLPFAKALLAKDASAPVAAAGTFPAAIQGTWCKKSDATDCFSESTTLNKYPDAFLHDSSPADASGGTVYTLCLERDQGDGCTSAAEMLVEYLPAGVVWDCVALEVKHVGWPSCNPDFTSAHDSTKPRVVILPNRQSENDYVDTEPMYRR
ncbi:MAG: hypothetical protein JWO10_697 [Microbacteriaceae bacterium]|nr:hypothetical protein [Microbacteriaceae bacterium]